MPLAMHRLSQPSLMAPKSRRRTTRVTPPQPEHARWFPWACPAAAHPCQSCDSVANVPTCALSSEPVPILHRMRAVLDHDDMVLLALSYCSAATLDSVCCVSQQELLSVLWVVLSKGRDGCACACLALDLEFIQKLMAWCPPHEICIPDRLPCCSSKYLVICWPLVVHGFSPSIRHVAVWGAHLCAPWHRSPPQCGHGPWLWCTPGHAAPQADGSGCEQVPSCVSQCVPGCVAGDAMPWPGAPVASCVCNR